MMELRVRTNNWRLFTIVGVAITLCGFFVYQYPKDGYEAQSILFSIVIFISGIFEIGLALTNLKLIKNWSWMLKFGFFDLVVGSILLINKDLSIELLSFVFGLWLIFRGFSQINISIFLKHDNSKKMIWSVISRVVVIIFGSLVIYNPKFGEARMVIWTTLSLIIFGVFSYLQSKYLNSV